MVFERARKRLRAIGSPFSSRGWSWPHARGQACRPLRRARAPRALSPGSWSQTTQEVGSTTWAIVASGSAQEQGIGNASGRATLANGALTIDWTTSNGYAGVYRWTLDAACKGTGTLGKLAGGLTQCKFGVVSNGLAPIAGGWSATFVIVAAKQGIKGKPKGTARFQLKGKSLGARNALARKITQGCH